MCVAPFDAVADAGVQTSEPHSVAGAALHFELVLAARHEPALVGLAVVGVVDAAGPGAAAVLLHREDADAEDLAAALGSDRDSCRPPAAGRSWRRRRRGATPRCRTWPCRIWPRGCGRRPAASARCRSVPRRSPAPQPMTSSKASMTAAARQNSGWVMSFPAGGRSGESTRRHSYPPGAGGQPDRGLLAITKCCRQPSTEPEPLLPAPSPSTTVSCSARILLVSAPSASCSGLSAFIAFIMPSRPGGL